MRHVRFKYGLALIFLSSRLFGQIDLRFDYELSDFRDIVKCDISLTIPNENEVQLYLDTINKYHDLKKDFFTQPGQYKLDCKYFINSKCIDSIVYSFELNGDEKEIEMSVDLGQDINSKWIKNKWTELSRKNQCYISIVKYFESPESIKLKLANIESSEYYKGPFFILTNFSKDTIYGEHLPGYFWGRLSFISDSIRSRELIGQIDMNFVDMQPLYPDSSRIAMVGSFGLFNKLPPNKYEYKLLFSTSGNTHGYRKYLDNIPTEWWAKTESFYKLIYDFEIR
jgi:hypothetical protein